MEIRPPAIETRFFFPNLERKTNFQNSPEIVLTAQNRNQPAEKRALLTAIQYASAPTGEEMSFRSCSCAMSWKENWAPNNHPE